MRALPHIIKKEFLQLVRTRSMIAISLGMPLIQILVLGWAISTDVEHVPTVIADLDNSATSRSLVTTFTNSRYLDISRRSTDSREVADLLRRGEVIIGVTIPSDFEHDLTRGEHPRISVTADAQNTNVALTGAGYVRQIILSWAQQKQVTNPGIQLSGSRRFNFITADSRIWYNPEIKSSYYMVPGIMVVLVTIITMMLTAMSIVRERESGTLEQLMVSPITRTELILGKTIPFGIIGLMELVISLIVIRAEFHVPIHGSLVQFLLMTMVVLLCTLGLGIFISTITTTQQQALLTTWFFSVFCILMSGFFLPLENMPKIWRTLTYINPIRYYMIIVRNLFLKGAGFAELWENVAVLALMAVVILTASIARFRKKMG
ncbi:ABC transporter permease [bacterium]|nr:ABC transporter permease [bacterium]